MLINGLSAPTVAINILLGVSLKFVWGMVNMLQFVIFMQPWKLNWPANALMAIKTLRTLALGEFIDIKKIASKISNFYRTTAFNQS